MKSCSLTLWGAPHRSCASSCSSSHPLRLAARTRAQRGKSRCAECPGRYLLWLQGTRASTARQVSHRCLGSSGARAAAGLPAEKQPLPLDRASPADTGSSPWGGFRGTTLWKWVQTKGPRKAKRPGKPCVVRTGLAGSLVTTAPRSFFAPSDPSQRRELCSHTEPKYRFPFPVQEHTIFAAYICKKIFLGPEVPSS